MVKMLGNKKIKIPDEEIANIVKGLDVTEEEAVQIWLEDEGIEINEEQEALCKKAKDNRITATVHQAKGEQEKKKREYVRKDDPDKEFIISQLADTLAKLGISYKVENVGKLISFQYKDANYKIDLIRRREKKQ